VINPYTSSSHRKYFVFFGFTTTQTTNSLNLQ
jgi:hypothetical protein